MWAARFPFLFIRKKPEACLPMWRCKPDYRATREELATLLWGDNPDALARHSLRQCLISLRQDLGSASEILVVDRETIGLRTQLVAVDARQFALLARSVTSDELNRAAVLWHGAFLSDFVLDIAESIPGTVKKLIGLQRRQREVFEALCRDADANGDGEGAIAAAERLVALEPTREDRQRTALKLLARHKGREAALGRLKLLADLLRSELGVAPEAATLTLIDAIKRGDFESSHAPNREQPRGAELVKPLTPATAPLSLPAREVNMSVVPARSALVTAVPHHNTARAALLSWRRQPPATAWLITALLLIGIMAVLELADGTKLRLSLTDRQQGQIIAVLPFAADDPGQSEQSCVRPDAHP